MDGPQIREVVFLRFHYVDGTSALFYGSKCSTTIKSEERLFEGAQMRFLTPFVRVMRKDHVRNYIATWGRRHDAQNSEVLSEMKGKYVTGSSR
jgi:hypothetical protein